MTYRKVLLSGEQILKEAGIVDAKTDAWLLLAQACNIDHTYYYVHLEDEIPAEWFSDYEKLIQKRAEHIPLQYITGEQEFMGLSFDVNPNVLIPRQDTETLVDEALKHLKPGMHVMDMCTGSGCILISLLKNCHGIIGSGFDVSKQALMVAKENAKKNEVQAEFERSDLFENVTGKYDMIVSNPPYIPTDEIVKLMPEVSVYEPSIALDGKEDGLYFYRKIVSCCKEYLSPDGMLLFEIGCEQGEEVSTMMRYAGFSEVQIIQDLTHHDRVVFGKL